MFQRAERKKAKLRLGLVGPSGSGKTYGALQVAFGLGGRVAFIDTENGSGDLYAHLGEYDICAISAPYTVEKYLAAIDEAERAGYNTLIIDSLSHAWAGDGGLLDQQGKIADSGKSGNSYTAWRTVTPKHYKLVENMLASKCHIIATMRAKTEYSQEKDDRGKSVIRKIGMAPVQREGMDYEFTLVYDLDINHNAMVSKDRTSLFDGQIFPLTRKTGEALRAWLETGVDAPQVERKAQTPSAPGNGGGKAKALYEGYLTVCECPEHAKNAMMKVTGDRKSKDWTDADLSALEADLERRKAEEAVSSTGEEEEAVFLESADLAEEKGIEPDAPNLKPKPDLNKMAQARTEIERLRQRVKTLFRESLGFTELELGDWLRKNFMVNEVKQLMKDKLKAALEAGEKILAARDDAELGPRRR
jgi:hypothetical protein